MTIRKHITASAVGALSLSAAALAQFGGRPAGRPPFLGSAGPRNRPGVISQSSARCSVVSISDASVSVEEARADAAANAAAFICGEGTASASAAAAATASAFAIAMAEVSASCVTSGNARGTAIGFAEAQVEAEVWLEAYAEAISVAVNCGDQCNAFTESFAFVGKDVFLSAYAATEAQINAYSDSPGEKIQQVNKVKIDIEEATVTAYAEALASVSAVQDSQGCFAFGNAEGCIVTEDDTICASCEVVSVGASTVETIDALAIATADATALACGDVAASVAAASSVATAIAEAHANAISFIYADCKSDDGGFACAAAESYVQETAFAVAEAFAEGWATAVSCDACFIEATDLSISIEAILVEASTSAFDSVCAIGDEHWTIADFQQHIVSGFAEAIAQACVLAIAVNPPAICVAATAVGTAVV